MLDRADTFASNSLGIPFKVSMRMRAGLYTSSSSMVCSGSSDDYTIRGSWFFSENLFSLFAVPFFSLGGRMRSSPVWYSSTSFSNVRRRYSIKLKKRTLAKIHTMQVAIKVSVLGDVNSSFTSSAVYVT